MKQVIDFLKKFPEYCLVCRSAAFLSRHLPGLCLFIYMVLATVGAFTGGLWGGIEIGFALFTFAAVWRIEGRAPLPLRPLLIFTLLALFVFAILNIQSTQPALSWHMWLQLATIFLPLALLSNPEIQKHAANPRIFALLPYAMMIGALLLGIELILQGPLLKLVHGPQAELYEYDRGFSYIVVLAFVAMAGLWLSHRWWLLISFIIILLFPAGLTESRAAKLAFLLGLVTVAVAYYLPRLTRYALTALTLLAVFWPFGAQKLFLASHDWINRLPPSWQDRLEIWDYTSYRVLDRPFFGWGLGSSAMLPFAQPNGALYHHVLALRAHPHNAVIQSWVELGLPGLAFTIVFALFALRAASGLPRPLAPFAMGAWVSMFCLAMISYSLWTDSLWAAIALTGFAFALMQRQLEGPNSPG